MSGEPVIMFSHIMCSLALTDKRSYMEHTTAYAQMTFAIKSCDSESRGEHVSGFDLLELQEQPFCCLPRKFLLIFHNSSLSFRKGNDNYQLARKLLKVIECANVPQE